MTWAIDKPFYKLLLKAEAGQKVDLVELEKLYEEFTDQLFHFGTQVKGEPTVVDWDTIDAIKKRYTKIFLKLVMQQ